MFYLKFGAGIKHDVLDMPMNVFHPRHQPGDRVIMLNSLPLVTCRWIWDLCISDNNKTFSLVFEYLNHFYILEILTSYIQDTEKYDNKSLSGHHSSLRGVDMFEFALFRHLLTCCSLLLHPQAGHVFSIFPFLDVHLVL